jgi:hypothetical protein
VTKFGWIFILDDHHEPWPQIWESIKKHYHVPPIGTHTEIRGISSSPKWWQTIFGWLFPMCSYWIPREFFEMFPIASHFYSICFGQSWTFVLLHNRVWNFGFLASWCTFSLCNGLVPCVIFFLNFRSWTFMYIQYKWGRGRQCQASVCFYFGECPIFK